MKLYLCLEMNTDILFESDMVTSYLLELTSYEGFVVNFNEVQKTEVLNTANKMKLELVKISSQTTSTELLFYSKNIEINVNVKNQLTKVNTTLAFFSKSSSSGNNSAVAATISATITKFSYVLQSVGRISNNNLSIV